MKKSLLFLLILFSILLASCGGTSTPAPTAEPVTDVVDPTVVAEGTLIPDPSVELSFAQPGIIAEVLVAEGVQVSEGQVIARLENIEVMQAEVAHAEEAYLMAEQAFNISEAMALKNLAEAHALLRETQQAFDNFDIPSDLRDMGTIEALASTYAELEEARANFEPYKYLEEQLERELIHQNPNAPEVYRSTAKIYKKRLDDAWADYRKAIQWAELEANLEAAKANVANAQNEFDHLIAGENSEEMAIARAQFETARANLEATCAALANYELRAPFAATVLSLDLSVGEAVHAGLPVAFLGDATHWQVETKDLAEVDIANVSIGDPVSVKLDAFPGEVFSARVTAIDTVGREYLGDMTYKVTIALDETDPRFLWNMTATVTISSSD
ncbi:MAG: HlyD family efflux transporter periplasmic adaptor subunit [Chloroflexota bacterium]